MNSNQEILQAIDKLGKEAVITSKTRITISLPEELIKYIEEYCDKLGYKTKSRAIEHILTEYFNSLID